MSRLFIVLMTIAARRGVGNGTACPGPHPYESAMSGRLFRYCPENSLIASGFGTNRRLTARFSHTPHQGQMNGRTFDRDFLLPFSCKLSVDIGHGRSARKR